MPLHLRRSVRSALHLRLVADAAPGRLHREPRPHRVRAVGTEGEDMLRGPGRAGQTMPSFRRRRLSASGAFRMRRDPTGVGWSTSMVHIPGAGWESVGWSVGAPTETASARTLHHAHAFLSEAVPIGRSRLHNTSRHGRRSDGIAGGDGRNEIKRPGGEATERRLWNALERQEFSVLGFPARRHAPPCRDEEGSRRKSAIRRLKR